MAVAGLTPRPFFVSMEEIMSEYKMVMRLWKGRIGHMAVELHGPDGERRVVGFGPANGGVAVTGG